MKKPQSVQKLKPVEKVPRIKAQKGWSNFDDEFDYKDDDLGVIVNYQHQYETDPGNCYFN